MGDQFALVVSSGALTHCGEVILDRASGDPQVAGDLFSAHALCCEPQDLDLSMRQMCDSVRVTTPWVNAVTSSCQGPTLVSSLPLLWANPIAAGDYQL